MSAQRASQLVEAGVWLQATGDHEGARRLFEQALKLDPDNVRARQFLGGKPGAQPGPAAAAPPSLGPEERVGTGTLLFAPADGARASTGTVLFGPGGSPPVPRAEPPPPPPPRKSAFFDPPDRPPPPVEMDWATEASERTPVARSPFGERTPVTPITAARKPLRSDATSGWDASGDQAPFFVAPPSSPGTAALKHGRDPLDLVTEGIHTPVPMKAATESAALRLEDELRTLLRGAKDLQELDDHSGALEILKKALELDPLHAEATRLRDKSERTLLAIYESKLGKMDAVPRVVLKQDEIIWLNLDHRAGFVLAQIDGAVSFDDLFAICGMSRLDTARILAQLVEEGVITSS